MNFIKALEKAQGLGVTKDEFIRLWEAELKVQPQNGSSEGLSQVSPFEANESIDQLAYKRQPDKDEQTQGFYSKLETLLDKISEKQDQIWQQVQSKNDQMKEELRQQFETVCQHVQNTVEYQTNSVKLFFMHELEIMKQNLTKMIDERCNKCETGDVSAAGSLQAAKVDLNQESGNTNKKSLNIRDIKVDMDDNEVLPRASYMAASLEQKEIKEEKQSEESFPDVDYDCHVESANRSPSLKDRKSNISDDEEGYDSASRNVPLNEKPGRFYYVVRSKAHSSSTLNNQTDVGTAKSSDSSCSLVTPLDGAPMEATGFYAKAISDQIKLSHSQSYPSIDDMASDKDWDSSSEQENFDYASSGKKDLARQQIFKYLHWDGFKIPDIVSYSDRNMSYMSPFLHPGTQSWKAHLSVSFGAGKQLKVYVYITEGNGDRDHEWPIRITANGFIFHDISKRFTQIWALPWVTCYKPSTTGVRFAAKICLATKRGSYPDVTYDELEGKRYFEKNKAVFKWNLKAEKREKL